MRPVRLKDIAAQAGVSVMTVSKALRGAPDISAKTTAHIRALAQQLGYVPDSMAQGLRNRTTRLLGLVLPTVANPIYSRTVSAIEEGAHDLGYEVILSHTLGMADREEKCIRRMLARRVDGIFIFPVYRMAPTAPIYVELEKRRTRVIILGQRAPFCAAFPNVETDDIAGSLSVTRHLIELGHKRIAFLCGPTISPWAQERLEGYRRGLREANIEFDDRLVFNAGGSIEEGESAALQMLNESVQMTAIQAATDLVAIGAANVFLKQGVQIPQEVSVAGYGNVLTAEYFRVPLTTVRQPKLRLGIAAIDMMAKLLRNETIESRRLPAELSVRGSTAAAKNGAPIS